MIHSITQLSYVLATALFVFALHWMNDPRTARRGVYAGVVAMSLLGLGLYFAVDGLHRRLCRWQFSG